MDGEQSFRRRAYANLCREFIGAAKHHLIDILERGDDTENTMIGLKNLAYCLCRPTAYVFEDTALKIGIFISYFKWPQALLAARDDTITIKFADSLAERITRKDAFSSDLIKCRLPQDLRTPAALEYAEQHKLAGLKRLITRSLP